ncbi:MAG: hypothetical protein AB4042_16840 [Leptolyngbyaceae cyanobacterium]
MPPCLPRPRLRSGGVGRGEILNGEGLGDRFFWKDVERSPLKIAQPET